MTNKTSVVEPSSIAVRGVTHDKIILFGDSLTELSNDILTLSFALTPALQHHYFRKLAVAARGYGGYSSDHLRHVLLPTIRAETAAGECIKLLVIEVGTNDVANNDMQHVPIERYKENLTWMIDMSLGAGVERVVVVGLGPVDEAKFTETRDRSAARTMEYAASARMVAEKCQVPFLDLWHTFMDATGWANGDPIPGQGNSQPNKALSRLLTDGVHLTGNGYKIWYTELLRIISETFPELRPEQLPTVLPHIFDVDRSNLPATLWQDVKGNYQRSCVVEMQ